MCRNRGPLGGFWQWISTVGPDIQIPEDPTQNRTAGQLKLVETRRLTAPSAPSGKTLKWDLSADVSASGFLCCFDQVTLCPAFAFLVLPMDMMTQPISNYFHVCLSCGCRGGTSIGSAPWLFRRLMFGCVPDSAAAQCSSVEGHQRAASSWSEFSDSKPPS